MSKFTASGTLFFYWPCQNFIHPLRSIRNTLRTLNLGNEKLLLLAENPPFRLDFNLIMLNYVFMKICKLINKKGSNSRPYGGYCLYYKCKHSTIIFWYYVPAALTTKPQEQGWYQERVNNTYKTTQNSCL